MREKMMDTLEYRDPWQDMLDAQDLWDELHGQIPEPEYHWFWVSCPKCGKRFWSSPYLSELAYQTHYLDHLLNDLKEKRQKKSHEPG
jgi:hypothetical protein